jgi:hypothetical protein
MKNNPLPRLDTSSEWRERLMPHCRLTRGDFSEDPDGKHRVGCLDSTEGGRLASRGQPAV